MKRISELLIQYLDLVLLKQIQEKIIQIDVEAMSHLTKNLSQKDGKKLTATQQQLSIGINIKQHQE